MEAYVIVIAAVITLVGTVYVARNSRKSADLAKQIEQNKTEATLKAEVIKTEVIARADVIKAETNAETQRIDHLLGSQQEFIKIIQDENKQQRTEMLDKDKLHREEMLQIREEVGEISRLMAICVEERSKFKYEVQRLRDVGKLPTSGEDVTIKGEMKGEVQ